MNIDHVLTAHGMLGKGGKGEVNSPLNITLSNLEYGKNATASWNEVNEAMIGYRYQVFVNDKKIYAKDTLNTSATIDSSNFNVGDKVYFEVRVRRTTEHSGSQYVKSNIKTVDKAMQNPPPAPSISNLEFNQVMVAGDNNTEVKLDNGSWYSSPRTFTGLIQETSYKVYARYPETSTHFASNSSASKDFTTPAEQKIYGVRIDKNNSNPNTRVSYIGDATGFTPMNGNDGNLQVGSWGNILNDLAIKPCILNNKTVKYYLNPNDFTKKSDGSNATLDGTDGDVMIEFGKTIWTKWTDEGSKYTIEFSDRKFSGAVKHAFEVEDGYNLVPYYPLFLTQQLFTVLFKSTDSQSALGRGRVDGAGYINTGNTDTKGMNYASTKDEQMKFLGIEDYWGNKRWWIDGVVTDSSYNIMLGKNGFNDAGSGYSSYDSGISSNEYGYIDSIQGGNDTGFIIKSGNGSETTYYSDYSYLNDSSVAAFGGNQSNRSSAGAFQLMLYTSGSASYSTIGARLFCASGGKIYIGAYLGSTKSGKLRSISNHSPSDNKTIGSFRNEAQANN